MCLRWLSRMHRQRLFPLCGCPLISWQLVCFLFGSPPLRPGENGTFEMPSLWGKEGLREGGGVGVGKAFMTKPGTEGVFAETHVSLLKKETSWRLDTQAHNRRPVIYSAWELSVAKKPRCLHSSHSYQPRFLRKQVR